MIDASMLRYTPVSKVAHGFLVNDQSQKMLRQPSTVHLEIEMNRGYGETEKLTERTTQRGQEFISTEAFSDTKRFKLKRVTCDLI